MGFNMVALPGDCHATLAMTNSALHGILQCECSDYVFTTQLFLSRTKYLMSLRGATRRGNLPEGTPCKKLRGNDREARKNRRKATVFCYRIVFGLLKLHKFRLAVHVSGETFKADFFHCRRNFVVIVSDAVCEVCVAAERNFPSAEFVVSFQDVDVGD